MDNIDAAKLRMHDAIWVDLPDGTGKRPDNAMSVERYPDGRVMVETKLNGWKEADQVHHRPGDEVPGEPQGHNVPKGT